MTGARAQAAMTHWVDYAYTITGAGVERDYSAGLYEALRALAPWLDEEPLAGVHPLRGLTPAADSLLLGGRSRLLLRVPASRIDACARLQGRSLDLPAPLAIGRANRRELLAHPVLHAKLVVTGAADEASFVTDVDCEVIVGRRGELRLGNEAFAGFSLMLHGLPPEHSLIAQAHGIGAHRKYGCGIFVPHKSVAAVGL